MIYIKRFSYRTQYDDFISSSGYKEPCIIKIGTPGVNDESTIVKYNLAAGTTPETMTLVRHWDGTTNLSSSQWKDKIANQYWTITKGTHGTGYYQFANTNPASATQYGTLNGNLPDLGYHWKIVADVGIQTQSTNPSTFVAFDFGSIGTVSSGKCAVCCGISTSSGKWYFNTKFNGNDGASTYNYNTSAVAAETITTTATWIRRTVTFGVRASNVSGKDEFYVYIPDRGEGYTTTPFTPLRFNRWESGKSFLGRSAIAPSSSYKYATYCRIYDIKVYGTA